MTLVAVTERKHYSEGRLLESELLSGQNETAGCEADESRNVVRALESLGYHVRDGQAVGAFVAESGLFDLLVETRQRLSEYFDDTCRLEVDLIVDPESLGWKFLAVTVRPGGNLDETMDRFEQYQDAWGLQANLDEPALCVTIG